MQPTLDSYAAAGRLQLVRRILAGCYAVVAMGIPLIPRAMSYRLLVSELALLVGGVHKLLLSRQPFSTTDTDLSERFSALAWSEVILTAPLFYYLASDLASNVCTVWIVVACGLATVCQLLAERCSSLCAWATGILTLMVAWAVLFYGMMRRLDAMGAYLLTMVCFSSITPGTTSLLRIRRVTNEFTHSWTDTVLRAFALLLLVLWTALLPHVGALTI